MLSSSQPIAAPRDDAGTCRAPLAALAGLGSAVPSRVLTNRDLEAMVDTSDDWIIERTGIRERRLVSPTEATSDLAIAAARRALADAGVPARDIDLIIVATACPDMLFPSTACLVQRALGARGAAAFDLAAACTGFIYALAMAEGAIAARRAETVLVIAAETLSRITDYGDRATCILFGDGAGAVVVRRAQPGEAAARAVGPPAERAPGYVSDPRPPGYVSDRRAPVTVSTSRAPVTVSTPRAPGNVADDPSGSAPPGLLSIFLAADGEGADLLSLPAGGSRRPASAETVANGLHYIHMNGPEVFKFAVGAMIRAVRESLKASPLSLADIDLLVPHQANARIVDAATRFLRVPAGRVFHTIEKYGNVSAASIPISLDEARRQGRLRPGDNVVLVAFGAGMTYGGAVLRWGPTASAVRETPAASAGHRPGKEVEQDEDQTRKPRP